MFFAVTHTLTIQVGATDPNNLNSNGEATRFVFLFNYKPDTDGDIISPLAILHRAQGHVIDELDTSVIQLQSELEAEKQKAEQVTRDLEKSMTAQTSKNGMFS